MIIKVQPDNILEELIQCDHLVLLLVWDRFDGRSHMALKEQEELKNHFGQQLKFLSLHYSDFMAAGAIHLVPNFVHVIPHFQVIYRGVLIQRAMQTLGKNGTAMIQTHLTWVQHYLKDLRLYSPNYQVHDDMHRQPDAAGWCTPGYNC
ncbi:MAG: hypothetical protein ACK5U7_03930 [Bacteroidota bacterium]|jgi:hypothetical protein